MDEEDLKVASLVDTIGATIKVDKFDFANSDIVPIQYRNFHRSLKNLNKAR
jgi:hypothetical protein